MATKRFRRTTPNNAQVTFGALAWVSSIQYFLVQWWVASMWPNPYIPSLNYISDLGSTTCGTVYGYSNRYVCSPGHHWMNLSFILLGLTTAMGAILARPYLMPGKPGLFSTSLFIASGIGVAIVGLNPENLAEGRHLLGAYLSAFGAILAIFLMGLPVNRNKDFSRLRWMNLTMGIILLGLAIIENIGFYTRIPIWSLGLGQGGIEKLFDYLVYSWLTLTGLFLLAKQKFSYFG